MSDIGNIEPPKLESDDRAGQFGPTLTVWNRWQPACDTCGRLESSLTGHGKGKKKQQQSLLSCSGKSVRSRTESVGTIIGAICFEADRKLSTVFAKSLGPGTINDPTFDLVDKVVQWNFLNLANHALIASAGREERFESRRVVLVPREKIEKYAEDQEWVKGKFRGMIEGEDVLPPAFDLHRYITHVNRGITHFHASFWPLPRDSFRCGAGRPGTSAAGRMEFPMLRGTTGTISGLRGQGVVGIELPDGTRVPIYKVGANGHFRRCAPGETDTDGAEEFKKLLVDPSRMNTSRIYKVGLETTEEKFPGATAEEVLASRLRPTGE
ncbi:hypothetical protein B0H14DRAFT_3136801 [Mycena olivaceomarginata]|nr:hypothetical protein B0H14DRAFT_3136801 [Mycena olivaceomarginata]